LGVSLQTKNTSVITDPTEIVQALVGLKDLRVLHFEQRGPDRELMIEQVPAVIGCPTCGVVARVKDRPVVRYIDLPVFGRPITLAWRKHRMHCVEALCPTNSWVRGDHRIAAKGCRLTTRAAKWATVQVGIGRTVKEVAGELGCDWHTVNDAVTSLRRGPARG
jgi:transposase